MGDNTDDADVVVETAEGEDKLVEIENFGVVERTDSESEWVETFDGDNDNAE